MRLNDELNNITFDEEEYFREYFKPMDIPEEAKKEREEASEDIFDLLLFMFLLIDENLNTGAFSYNDLLMEFQRRYADIIATYGRNDAYFQQYLGLVPGEILDTTIKNLDNEYYTSEERAASVSANEANGILNYEELQRKIDEGYTHKTWKAEIDRKTRLDHDEMNGTTIPIEEYFVFSDCEMMMPHDEVNGTARQVVNCRCSLKYSSQQNRVEKPSENDTIESATISSGNIAQRNTGKGNPNAILVFGTGLNNRQRKILDFLQRTDDKHEFNKKDVSMRDLSALTAETGDEFAMFTRKGKRLIMRGDHRNVYIYQNDAEQMASEGYRWSGHTHPGTTFSCLKASDGDKLILKAFNQKRSVVYNSSGKYETFGLS